MNPLNAYAAIVLAAGAASRWKNGPKALANWRGRTLLDHACHLARSAGCAPVYRVLGAHREVIEAQPAPEGIRTVHNPDWADGLGSSLACGMRALAADPSAAGCAGVLVLLCDQPLVSPETLHALREAHAHDGRSLVFAGHGDGRIGPPALFARVHWPELAALTGAEGARRLARAHPEAVAIVPAPEAAEDIDTPEDYARLCRQPI
jgi:molybdenum cofactor cytidylyltransferase